MKIYTLIMTDTDIRPNSDVTTVALFVAREAAEKAMAEDIDCTVENRQIEESDIQKYPERGYACSDDGRFSWKIEEHILNI